MLHYTRSGVLGPPLLLVHGWGGDGGDWAPLLTELDPRRRVIVPDLRGHGRSFCPASDNTPTAMAADLALLLRRLGVAEVVAIGHSMGGQVVTALAVRHPDLVRAVVVLDPAYGADETEAAGIHARLSALRTRGVAEALTFAESAFTPETPAAVRERQLRLMAAMPAHVLAQAYAGMYLDPGAFGIRPATERFLAHRRCPALSVWTSLAAADWDRGTVNNPCSEVHHWPGCGHYLHLERPAALAALLGTVS
jgi:pimeloyl-ACP methyl ester carboxylesterase